MSKESIVPAFSSYYLDKHEDPDLDDVGILKQATVMSDGTIQVSEGQIDLDNNHEILEVYGQDPILIKGNSVEERLDFINSRITEDKHNLGAEVTDALTARSQVVANSANYENMEVLTKKSFSEEPNPDVVLVIQVDENSPSMGVSSDGIIHHGLNKDDFSARNIQVNTAGLNVIDAMHDPEIIRENRANLSKDLDDNREFEQEIELDI